MFDRFDRRIDYLRVSVTDRCDLRCIYCMPADGVPLKPHARILTYEQILRVVSAAADLGITKVRITGGEPLVRREIDTLIRGLARTPGIAEVTMTTNGTRLRSMAARLRECGLDRVNISVDTLDPERFRQITRGGDLRLVLDGVDAAIEAGLTPVKINMVLLEDTTPAEVAAMRRFCEHKGATLQTIEHFSLVEGRRSPAAGATQRPGPCGECNRLRLTSDGFLKPCLMSDDEIKVDFSDIHASLLRAANGKPEQGRHCHSRPMIGIGG